MPKCKNDPTRSYKGTEPSPKGLGYCAHGMKEGDKKKGKDGNVLFIEKDEFFRGTLDGKRIKL